MDKNVKQKLQLSKNCNKTLLQIVTENHYKNGITTNNSYYKDCQVLKVFQSQSSWCITKGASEYIHYMI